MKKILLILGTTALVSCTGWQDNFKDFESDTFGLQREIKVYSYTGQLLTTYKGNKVRISYDTGGKRTIVLLDGKRITIDNATVIIEEK